MTNKELADLLLPGVDSDISKYEEKYPERNLKEGAIVTRFAPSPTGFVHMGSLFQSFISRKVANDTEGIFFLRVEDTDQKRLVENSVKGIVSDLKNFNIEIDEGMLSEEEEKGTYGPYMQSLRKEIYQSFVKYLIEQGKAELVDEAYDKYLDPAKTPIPLMPIYEKEVFEAIKEAGGYVSLAHPTSLKLDLENLKEYIKYLKSIGLDSIEVYHSQQKRKYSNHLIKIAKELELYTSGGSDYHGPIVKPRVHLGLDKGYCPQKVLTLQDKIVKNK